MAILNDLVVKGPVKFLGSVDANLNVVSAEKLTTSAGGGVNPIYFSGGKPVACAYSLNKSVPSDAVFTDNNVTNTLATTTKAYITGTTSSTTNTGTQVFDTGVYLDTTAGMLTATTFKGNLSGNADTASKLATARTIFGNTFDGTGNVEGKAVMYGHHDTSYSTFNAVESGLEIRENDLVHHNQSDMAYAPAITFHWGNIVASKLLLHSDGIFYFKTQAGGRSTVDTNIIGDLTGTASNAVNATNATNATNAVNADTVDSVHISATNDGVSGTSWFATFNTANVIHAIDPARAYVGTAGNANTVGGISDGYYLGTLNSSGGTHGAAHRIQCKYNVHGDRRFKFITEDGGHEVRCDYATDAYHSDYSTYADSALTASSANTADAATISNTVKDLRTDSAYADIFSTTLSADHGCWNKWCFTVGQSVDSTATGYIVNAPYSHSAIWFEVLTLGVTNRAFQLAIGCFTHQRHMFIRYMHDAVWSGWFKINTTAV